jgi:S-adenosylmethionine/arginine decarboxylase-like enzyme
MSYEFKGQHYTSSFKSCNFPLYAHEQLLGILRGALEKVNASILSYIDQTFTNEGYTCVFLLKESHCSIHTYPEHASAFIDFFTCDAKCSMGEFHTFLVSALKPESSEFQIQDRQ